MFALLILSVRTIAFDPASKGRHDWISFVHPQWKDSWQDISSKPKPENEIQCVVQSRVIICSGKSCAYVSNRNSHYT